MVQNNPTLRSILENINQTTLEQLVEANPQFGIAFSEYLRVYGCRALRYKIADPTLAESPMFVLSLIQDQIVRGYNPAADASALRKKRSETVEEAHTALSQLASEDQDRFERTLKQAEESYPVREDNEFYTFSAPVGLIHYGLLEIGRRMVERKQIEERDDVFFLKMGEAKMALRDGSIHSALVRRRKGERAWILAHPGPAIYGKNPGPPPSFRVLPSEARMSMEAALWYMDRIFTQEQTRQAEAASGVLVGISASPGEYIGTVREIMDESEFDKVKANDVLVCPITSPVWSVLFPSIGALVTDTGGILSHPAIIAREYRVPAVVATGRATRVLRDDQTVKVNGYSGIVQVLA